MLSYVRLLYSLKKFYIVADYRIKTVQKDFKNGQKLLVSLFEYLTSEGAP